MNVGAILISYYHPENAYNLASENIEAMQGIVSKLERDKNITIAVSAILIDDHWQPVSSKVYTANKEVDDLQIGDHLLLKGRPNRIVNKHEETSFDYALYRKQQGIIWQFYGNAENMAILGKSNSPLLKIRRWSSKTQKYLAHTLDKYFVDREAAAIAKALILGFKADIDVNVQARFAGAGVMHLLAVSGLHVGIIYLICYFLLGRVSGYRQLKIAILICVIFTYALITGLSPSVLRASVMIAVVLLGSLLQRKTNVYNSLTVAAFLLLSINPLMIFQVGFQLSFAAVTGIVWLYPKIHSIWRPSNKYIGYFWSLLCVSGAAQLATLPLTWFYFQQFPAYFLLPNLILVPMTGIFIMLGFVGLALSFMPWLASVIFKLLEYALQTTNSALDFLLTMPGAVISLPTIQPIPFLAALIMVIFSLLFYQQRRVGYLYIICILAIGLLTHTLKDSIHRKGQHLLLFYPEQPMCFEIVFGEERIQFGKMEDNIVRREKNATVKANGKTAYFSLQETAGLSINLNKMHLAYGNAIFMDSLKNPTLIIIDNPKLDYFELMAKYPQAIWVGTSGLSYNQRKELTSFAKAQGIQFDSPEERGVLTYAFD